MAYPKSSHVDTLRSKIQFYLRQNSKGVFCTVAFLLVVFIITSDAIHDMGRRTGSSATTNTSTGGFMGQLRGQQSSFATTYQLEHWGGAMHPGIFRVDDAILTDKGTTLLRGGTISGSAMFRFATVTDLDQLSAEHHPMVRRRIGIVLQDFGLVDHLSVFENVALPLRIRGLNINEYTRDIIELLDWVGLGHRIDAEPAVLSGGEQQRVCIARAVISRPDLILADEPTGNVDPEMAERLLRLFAELNKLGATILVATHDYSLITRFKANVLKLSDGQLWGVPASQFEQKNPIYPENMDIMTPQDISTATMSVENIDVYES